MFITQETNMAPNTEMAVGLHKGHKTTKTVQKPKPSRRKGVRTLHFLYHVGIMPKRCYLFLQTSPMLYM